MGYRFQFVTLAGFHALNLSAFELAYEFKHKGMLAYSQLQQREFELAEKVGYSAVTHQRFVGTGYFDQVATTIASGNISTCAMHGSTEEEQFEDPYDHLSPCRGCSARSCMEEEQFENPYDHEVPEQHATA